jgi:phage gp45-like
VIFIRSILSQVVEGLIKRFSGSGRVGEVLTDGEAFEHYGFTSRPWAGAEGIVLTNGTAIVLIASDDRRYRLAVEEGEVALYDDLGQKVYLTRTGVVVSSPAMVNVTAPIVNIYNATEINLGADSQAAVNQLIDMRLIALYNEHTHPDPQGGSSGEPSPQLSLGNCATNITRAI